jgi:hypothetical protein
LWKAEKDMAAGAADTASKFTEELDPVFSRAARASTPHPEVEYEITPDEWRVKTSRRLSACQRLGVH